MNAAGIQLGCHDTVTLKPVEAANRDRCIALRVAARQEHLIAPNARSLAQAEANPQCVPLAIYAAGELVGFTMYEPRGNDVSSIHRFMIAEAHQRQGIGRRAMRLLMERLQVSGCLTIYLSFRPENLAARRLYASLGFVEHEIESDGEVVFRHGPVRDVSD